MYCEPLLRATAMVDSFLVIRFLEPSLQSLVEHIVSNTLIGAEVIDGVLPNVAC